MTENPNIKAEILLYALKQDAAGEDLIDIPEFAEKAGYDQTRVCRKVDELYPMLEFGTSPRFPWIGYKQLPEIRKQLREWGYLE